MPQAGNMTAIGPASADLGLGDPFGSQVTGETEEERRRRLAEIKARASMGPASQALGLSPLGVGGLAAR